MKLLITGATGIIGRKIIERVVENSFEINFLTTRKSKLKSIKNAKGFFWNPNKNIIDLNCFNGVDSIIHLSGKKISRRWTKKHKKGIYESRVLTTKLLFNSISELKFTPKIKSFICASAIGIYKSEDNKIHYEKNKIYPSTFLEKLVYDWEKSSFSFKKHGIRVVNLRIGLVFSSGGFLKIIKTFGNFGLISSFGSGNQFQSWIHIDDLIEIFLLSIKDKWDGIYNAVSPQPINQNKMMELISRTLNRPYIMPNIPSFFLNVIFGEMSSILISSHRVSSEKVLQKGFVFKYADIEKALKDILN
ncbi:MAG: TIGR01777 family protein [Flavobacteriaceae bacterium]|nr:TIGR01777 family protein [Flavobacteriaceae bacterium]